MTPETERVYRNTITAGLLIRRDLRANLDVLGVEWREYKGLTESTFVVTGSREQWDTITGMIQRFNS